MVTAGQATAATGSSSVATPRTQELAILLGSQTALSVPGKRSTAVEVVSGTRPITLVKTVLPVIGHRTVGGIPWLRIQLPGRPNGHTGWIRRSGTSATRTSWRLVVDISDRRVTVLKNGRPVRILKAIVGTTATPTPTGAFFVEEVLALRTYDIGAPYAFALSARSNVLQEFGGGPGQIAFHGLANVGGVLGTAVSHGCIRLDTEAVTWLAARIGPGFPVTIRS